MQGLTLAACGPWSPLAPLGEARAQSDSPSGSLAGSQSGSQSGSPSVATASAPALVPFIDAHVHLNDEAMQLALMQAHGVERAVICWGRNSDNASIADAARRHPQRFIAFASISPERSTYRRGWQTDATDLLTELDRLLDTGHYRGIGEISAVHFPSPGFAEADFDPMSPTMIGILDLARRYRMPVMLHVEWTRMAALSALLDRFHDVPVIWAHGGYTPAYIAQRMLARHPNLTYELSARTWPLHPRSPDYTILRDGVRVWPQWLALIATNAGRFIVGTDASHRSAASERMKHESVQAFLRQLGPDERDRVARGNLLGLLAAR